MKEDISLPSAGKATQLEATGGKKKRTNQLFVIINNAVTLFEVKIQGFILKLYHLQPQVGYVFLFCSWKMLLFLLHISIFGQFPNN